MSMGCKAQDLGRIGGKADATDQQEERDTEPQDDRCGTQNHAKSFSETVRAPALGGFLFLARIAHRAWVR